jgi:hypothetical protein
MNFYFWTSLAEIYRERNPLATFFYALLVLFALLALGVAACWLICALGLDDYAVFFLAGAVVIFCCWLIRRIRRVLARMRDGYVSKPLSRDEIIKAQTKLAAHSNFKKSPTILEGHRCGQRGSRATR